MFYLLLHCRIVLLLSGMYIWFCQKKKISLLLIKHKKWGKYVSKFMGYGVSLYKQHFPYILHWKPHAWWCVIIAYSSPSWVIFKPCADNISPCLAWWWQLPVNHKLIMTHHQNFSYKMSWWWLIFRLLLIFELVMTHLQALHLTYWR